MGVKIVLADDQPVARLGLNVVLGLDATLHVVAETDNGAQALSLCRQLQPDLLVLEARLPVIEGLLVVEMLKDARKAAAPRIIVFTASPDAALVRAALDAGADAYVLKTTPVPAVLSAVHRVLRGERVLLGVDDAVAAGHVRLSPKEAVTLTCLARGLRTKEIARSLSCSARTTEAHLTRMYGKLGVSSRAEAVAVARQEHLL